MTIRHAIDQLLTGESAPGDAASDPATILSEQGFNDVPSELFGTALVHFSDTAPLEQADALAPIVTRVGPVPFEEGDLPEVDGAGFDPAAIENGDAFSMFQAAPPVVAGLAVGLDEVGLDEAGEFETELDEIDDVDVSFDEVDHVDQVDQVDETGSFGEGSEEASEEVAGDDALDLDALAPRYDAGSYYEDDGLGGGAPGGLDEIAEEGPDLFSVEFDETDQLDDGADPNDMDFDIE